MCNLGFMAENGTVVTEFILMGSQLEGELQMGLIFMILVLHLITRRATWALIVLSQSDPCLQTSSATFPSWTFATLMLMSLSCLRPWILIRWSLPMSAV